MQPLYACFYATIVIYSDEMLITLAPVANISENVLPSFMAVARQVRRSFYAVCMLLTELKSMALK